MSISENMTTGLYYLPIYRFDKSSSTAYTAKALFAIEDNKILRALPLLPVSDKDHQKRITDPNYFLENSFFHIGGERMEKDNEDTFISLSSQPSKT